jgi:type I restriction enzyme S subunit
VELPYVALEHIASATGRFVAGFEPEVKGASAEVLFRRGDVLFGKLRPYLAKVIAPEFDGMASGEFIIMRPTSDVDSRFLYYLCLSQPFLDWAHATSVGTKMPRTDWDQLSDFRFTLPSLTEQRAIAAVLDRETARLDRLVERKQALGDLLEARRRAVALALLQVLASKNGEVPLKRLVQCLDGQRIPLSADERGELKGPYPYHGASEIVDWVDDYLFDETLVLLGEDGAQLADPLFPIARVVEGKMWVNNHAHVLRPRGVDPHYLSLALNAFDRHAFISGATRPKITQSDMNEIPIPRASDREQRQFLIDHQRTKSSSEPARRFLRQQVERLRERRQALITAAVTGQIKRVKVAD